MAVALEWQPEPDGVFEVSLVESVCLPPYVLLKGGGGGTFGWKVSVYLLLACERQG